METPAAYLPTPRSRYFLTATCLALAVVLIGFWKTFFLPTFQGTFTAPAIIYVHGGLLFLWTVFLVSQAMLVRTRRIRIHRRIGFIGLALACGVSISTMVLGVYILKRDVAAGGGHTAISSIVGMFTTPIIFLSLVGAAIVYRRRPEVHKRLILLAMLSVLWAAFLRFRHYFPPIQNWEIIFGGIIPSSMILVAVIWEKYSVKRVHPVYIFVGLPLMAEGLAEAFLFDSAPWQAVAYWFAGFFI
jgi:hypothetical protein